MKAPFSLLLYLSFIVQIKSPTITYPCKLFPKILGGVQEYAQPTSIDANLAKDIIVLAGHTKDSGIVGFNLNTDYQTYIASFSISSTRIYWAKADTSKKGSYYPNSISLSPNAKYVVVYLYWAA